MFNPSRFLPIDCIYKVDQVVNYMRSNYALIDDLMVEDVANNIKSRKLRMTFLNRVKTLPGRKAYFRKKLQDEIAARSYNPKPRPTKASPKPNTSNNPALQARKSARKEEILRRIEEDRKKRGVNIPLKRESDVRSYNVSREEEEKARNAKEHSVVKKARKVAITEEVNGSGKLRIYNSKRQYMKIIPSGRMK